MSPVRKRGVSNTMWKKASKCWMEAKNEPATKTLVLRSQKWKQFSFVFTTQRVFFIKSSFHRAKRLLHHIILMFWGGCCFLLVAFGQNMVRKGIDVFGTKMRLFIDQRSSPMFQPKIAIPRSITSRIRLIWLYVTFIDSEDFLCQWKASAMLIFRPCKRRVPTSSEPCRQTI